MKKIISKREYDTEAAELIRKFVCGAYGDAAGYEESLYRMPNGWYFLYYNGGEASPYPAELIKAVSKANAEAWQREHT